MPRWSEADERRRDLRIDVSFPIVIETAQSGRRTPGVVENVSLGGVLLRTETPLDVRTEVTLEIQAGEAPALELPATVVRTFGAQSYGTTFVSLSEADADRLMDLTAQFLRSAAPAPWFIG